MANSLKVFIIFLCMKGLLFGSPSDHIPQEDKKKLELLFRNLMLDNYFAYTLFDDKPITFYGRFYEPYYKSLFAPKKDDLFFSHWKVWKKYESQFPMRNFSFIENDYGMSFGLFLVNKKATIALIENNKQVFEEHFGCSISSDEILEKILNTKDYFQLFGNNQLIYGLLFGFGYRNSLLFHLKNEKQYFYLEGVGFHDEPQYPLHIIPLPFFMNFESNDEVFQLRKKYEEERKRIIEIYSKGNFLDITLKQLAFQEF